MSGGLHLLLVVFHCPVLGGEGWPITHAMQCCMEFMR